jgi:transcriptional regulator with XRE-family HTH domain
MQAQTIFDGASCYDDAMPKGRPSLRERPPFGERVFQARQACGLSQTETAARLGLTQSGYAAWERDPVALRPEQIGLLAAVLEVTTEQLLGNEPSKRAATAPAGRARQLFDAVSKLPRRQQEKIFDIIQPFVAAHSQDAQKSA